MIDLNAFNLTTAQRIVEAIRRKVRDTLGLSDENVQLYDRHNGPIPENGLPPDAWAVIAPHEDDIDDESPAGYEDIDLPITIDLHLVHIPDAARLTNLAEAAIAVLHQAVLADPQWHDDTTNRDLAIDTRVTGRYRPDPHADQDDPTCGIDLVVTTRQPFGDPFTNA